MWTVKCVCVCVCVCECVCVSVCVHLCFVLKDLLDKDFFNSVEDYSVIASMSPWELQLNNKHFF